MTTTENAEIIENQLKEWGFTNEAGIINKKKYLLGNIRIYFLSEVVELAHAINPWLITFDLEAPLTYFFAMVKEAIKDQESRP